MPQLYEEIAGAIGRRPAQLPLNEFMVSHGQRLADVFGVTLPFVASWHANEIGDTASALTLLLGRSGIPLHEGVRRLIEQLPEVTPDEGRGGLDVKHFYVDITDPAVPAPALLRQFRERFRDLMPAPVGVEPASPGTTLDEGGTVTIALPGRGHVQVRVEEVTDTHVIVATLRGHIVAGVVKFSAMPTAEGIRFSVLTCDTAANPLDWLGLTLGGARIQDANWMRVAQNAGKLAGGRAGRVVHEAQKIDKDDAAPERAWINAVVRRHRANIHQGRT
jgi:NADH dehydrogenase